MVGQPGGARVSYLSTAAFRENIFVQVSPQVHGGAPVAGDFLRYRISVQDTTLYAPWFATTDATDTEIHVQNTSDWHVTFTLTHYAAVITSGGTTAVVGMPYSFTLPGFGSTSVQSKVHGAVPAGTAGSLKITHNGPPGTIKGSATSTLESPEPRNAPTITVDFSPMVGAQVLR